MGDKTIRYGTVSAVDSVAHAVKVAFEDEDGMVSDWLPVLVCNALKNRDYGLPDPGERVVCAFLSNGTAAGFCLGAVYSQANQPPHNNQNMRSVKFEDGTTVSYDRGTHTLTVDCKGTINLTATGGDIVVNGISLVHHVHPENDSGGPTGPPQ